MVRVPRAGAASARALVVRVGAIGLGFMFVEMPLINRFSVYLGHPSYSTVVVLGTMLVSAGAGSLAVGRVSAAAARNAVLLVPVMVGLLFVGLDVVLQKTLGLSLGARMCVAALSVAPCGVVMGFAFPSGMLALGDENRPWFWAVNGAASVLASVFALLVAMAAGFLIVLSLAILCYLVAALVLTRTARTAA